MSTSNYIRPMSFREIIGSAFRVFIKILVPAFFLNFFLTLLGAFVGMIAIAGPTLLVSSNAILGKRLKIWDSVRKGMFSITFLKILALSSIVTFIYVLIVLPIMNSNDNLGITLVYILHIILDPMLIYIPMIMFLEKKGLRASIRRSFQVLRANFSRTVGMIILMVAILLAITFIFMAASQAFADALLYAYLIMTYLGLTVLPYVFLYYEYRARHENYNEELLTQELGYLTMDEMMTV